MLRQRPPFHLGDDDEAMDDPDAPYDPAGIAAEIDSELQAAIEYKIAMSGRSGAETVLRLLNEAVRRHR